MSKQSTASETYKFGITVNEHLLLTEAGVEGATGRFTLLMTELITSAKLISREVNKAGLADILGLTGNINVQGEKVSRLDEFADRVLIWRMQRSGLLCAISSEENEGVIEIPADVPRGNYIIIFDPLDGSSNVDANVSIGTIFSIYRRKPDFTCGHLANFFRSGSEQIAAGYFLYGASTMLVYTVGNGVNGFTLDPSVGEFLLSHRNIRIPEDGAIYSVNESNHIFWDERTTAAVDYFKSTRNHRKAPYTSRYIGSMVADFHRNLLYGGLYMYPADTKNSQQPNGKLRLLCEAAPMAFLAEQAGGAATDGERRILDIQAHALHQRVPLFTGSKNDVERATAIMQGRTPEI